MKRKQLTDIQVWRVYNEIGDELGIIILEDGELHFYEEADEP